MTDVPDCIAGARALLTATRGADLLAEVERHILLLADQPDSALGDVPASRRRGHLDAAAVVGRYRALLADQPAARTTPDNPPTSGDAASCGDVVWHPAHRFMRGVQIGQCPGWDPITGARTWDEVKDHQFTGLGIDTLVAGLAADATTRHVGTSTIGETATPDDGLPTHHLRMSTGARVPTIDQLIAALADVAAERRLTTAEVERLRAAAVACGYAEADAAPATADDGLRKQYAVAARQALGALHLPWTELSIATATGAVADAMLAVRDRRIEQLAEEADADSKRLAEVDERCDRYAVELAQLRTDLEQTRETARVLSLRCHQARETNGRLNRRCQQADAALAGLRRTVDSQAADLKRLAGERGAAEATVGRVRALAADMRTWCSRHNIAVDYAQRIDDALAGPEADRA